MTDHASELAAGVHAGDIIAGKYRVDRILGIGGMGVVVAAHHLDLDERCALKFLLPLALGNPQAVARFVREARAAVKIKSEHVARVSDVGTLENGSPYMVMEYLDGEDLDTWLQKRGALPIEQAVEFVLQACEAIADAHALGIIHRDLKPANLFCIERSDGGLCIKVLDFGISKVTGPGDPSQNMTRTTAFLGSPLYMSPEQMKSSRDVDARTDLWSLGVILFELLTGRVPYMADNPTELVFKVATESAPLVRSVRADVPAGLERVIATCLEREPVKRFQTVGDLAVALAEFAPAHARASVDRVVGTLRKAGGGRASLSAGETSRLATPSVAASVAAGGSPAAPAATAAAWGQTGSEPKSNRAPRVALGAALTVAVAAALGGAAILRSQAHASVTTASSAAPVEGATAAPEAPLPTPSSAVASATPVASAPAQPPVVATTPPASPSAGADRPPSSPVRPSPAPAMTAASKSPTARPNCKPPYVIDSAGDRQYKPECL
jgi:hypothetical protein